MGQEQPTKLSLRIAMSAHSLIYAPLYLAAHNINNRYSNFVVEFVSGESQQGFGDEGAYQKIKSPRIEERSADICVCDPMVVINDVKNLEKFDGQREAPAPIVGLIVHRPALWLICLENSSLKDKLIAGGSDKLGSVANRVARNIPTNLGNVFRYEEGSSAHYYLKYEVEEKHFTCTSETDIAMGEEKPFLSVQNQLPDGALTPDVIMTCELLEAYKYKDTIVEQPEGQNPLIFAWHRHSGVIPFTAIVANRNVLLMDENRKNAVIELLEEVQHALSIISNTKYSKNFVNAFLGFQNKNADDSATDEWENTLSRVQTVGSSIFPASIRPDKIEWSSWEKACEIWGISKGADGKEFKKMVLKRSINKQLAQMAFPISALEKSRSFLHKLQDIHPSDSRGATLFATVSVFVISFVLWQLRTRGIIPSWIDLAPIAGFEALSVLLVFGSVVVVRSLIRRKRLREARSND